MKLKKWLVEKKQITYAEYKALPEEEQWQLWSEHQQFCRWENRQNNPPKKGPGIWRKMTPEEMEHLEEVLAKEKERYEKSLMCGGVDENGNYTALHYRW